MSDVPHVFVFEDPDEDASSQELARRLADIEIRKPLILCSHHGRALINHVEGQLVEPDHALDQQWAATFGSEARDAGADAIVAVGGGRTLDVGKLAAARAGLPVVAVPTQLSHDGICSPVAVVPGPDGRAESLGAIAPTAVFISLPTVQEAPPESIAAGVGDLLANPLALRDWRLAADHGLEELDDRAWDLSVESYELIRDRLEDDPPTWSDPTALRILADALVLSGLAMIAAHTSRPASGGEHEISHAIDELHGGRAHHGAQVAFGCVISTALYDGDVPAYRTMLRRLGLPDGPEALGLDRAETIEIILHAPDTRPGRFTVLEDRNLDRREVEELVDEIFRVS